MIKKEFYRPDEVAKMLSVSIDFVYKLIRDKELHAVKISSVYRIPAKALNRLKGEKPRLPDNSVNI